MNAQCNNANVAKGAAGSPESNPRNRRIELKERNKAKREQWRKKKKDKQRSKVHK
jgi:hypothetical protein